MLPFFVVSGSVWISLARSFFWLPVFASGFDFGRDAVLAAKNEYNGTGKPTLITKMLEEKLIYGKKKKGEVSVKVAAPVEKVNDFKQKQLLICNEIEKIMKNQFANVTYSIKKSESTSSVYLSFINSHNINKTIRFSDHGSSKNIRQYSEKVVFSNKAMVRIIESNLKSLSKKTVIVLLKQLENGGK